MTDKHTVDTEAEANGLNMKLLLAHGVSRTDALMIIDMVHHFERQVEDLAIRVLQSLPDGVTSPITAAIMGVVLERKGAMMKRTIFEHYGIK